MGKPLGSTGEFFRRRDEWRKHPMLSNQLRHATPGLGIALVAFGIYLVGEQDWSFLKYKMGRHKHSSGFVYSLLLLLTSASRIPWKWWMLNGRTKFGHPHVSVSLLQCAVISSLLNIEWTRFKFEY